MPTPTILLLDDDADVLELLQKFLQKRGYDVTATAWPADAAEIIGRTGKCYDVLITDIRMPAISGFTLMRAVHEAHPETSIIVLSGLANSAMRQAASDYGAIACLEKPVDTELLLEAILRATHTEPHARR